MPLTVIRNLGSGGFGVVDLVQDEFGLQYARKTFSVAQPLSPALIENVKKRFSREARIQSGISHRNIVPVVRAELDLDPPFYLMAVAQDSLQDQIDKDPAIKGAWIRPIADIVSALDELHQMGIYHRDLKPQNVLRYITETGFQTQEYYALSDFGLIAMNESRLSLLTTTGMAKGTDYYTAPEITSDLRRASPQSDIYSLGCILHDIVGLHARVPCAEIKEDGEYGAILRNCTRSDPSRRFQSVRSVLDALNAVSSVQPTFGTAVSYDFSTALANDGTLDEANWRALIDFVEDNEGTTNAYAVLGLVSYQQAVQLSNCFPSLADRLGAVYSRWVHGGTFSFESCDRLANVLEVFTASTSYETRADAIMALLRLGTSHNRWYVERRFMQVCSPSMEDVLARRLAVEFRAGGTQVCEQIGHLEKSISTDRAHMHPELVRTLREICP